ncbi:MAG: NAD-dependent epimerase [Chitinophagia bacterium]|nr:NAD-dependent epimerase [Chitinophagia bacterium]
MPHKILITGTAGFIGFHLASALLEEGHEIVGLDSINDYYDVRLKMARLQRHGIHSEDITSREICQSRTIDGYRFIQADLADHDFIVSFLKEQRFDFVVNLAAQAGVRHSLEKPRAYTHSNIDGFLSILEGCRHSGVKHLVYASTSSVYGLNKNMPFNESGPVDHPMALYAATKKANELMAHAYSHLFGIPTSGLRFFTVYGPWGRPDMALFLFTDAILKGEPIKIFNHGRMLRDFTYVGDIVESIRRLVVKPVGPDTDWNPANPSSASSSAPYRIFNIGNASPVPLMDYIRAIEDSLGMEAKKVFMDMQPGDVPATHADTSALEAYVNFRPSTSIRDGVSRFIDWYRDFYIPFVR